MEYKHIDFKGFWSKSEESNRDWIKPMPIGKKLSALEERFGYRLPESYIQFMEQTQNGGLLSKDTFPLLDGNGAVTSYLKCTFLYAISPDYLFSIKEYSEKWERSDFIGEGIRLGDDLNATRATYFILDYANLNQNNEPKVSYIKGYWDMSTTKYTQTIIADSFEEFVSKLIKSPKPTPFDFATFKDLLKIATTEAFQLAQSNYPEDDIVAFGLYTNTNATVIAATINTAEWLKHNITENPDEVDFYTYETMEWKYEGYNTENIFTALEERLINHVSLLIGESKVDYFRNKILNVFAEVLEELKAERAFSLPHVPEPSLMVNVASDGLSINKWKQTIKRLNES